MGVGRNSKQKFKKYALSKTKKTIKALHNLPKNLVSFVEKTSSIFLNETKCYRKQRSVVLITGGDDAKEQGWNRAAEIYNPMTKSQCTLPDLLDRRYGHTQNENLICGGGSTRAATSVLSCVLWNSKSGNWTQSHTLNEGRRAHISWASESGVYLMGGEKEDFSWDPTDTSELLTENAVLGSNLRKYNCQAQVQNPISLSQQCAKSNQAIPKK